MVASFEIRGAENLAALGARLKMEAEGRLRRELLAGIRVSVQRAIPDVRSSAMGTLPHGGGLAARVAGQTFASRSSLAGASARVQLRGKGMRELRDIDQGRVRHPVYGNRAVWSAQTVPAGFFTKPMQEQKPAIRRDIEVVMALVAHQIARRF